MHVLCRVLQKGSWSLTSQLRNPFRASSGSFGSVYGANNNRNNNNNTKSPETKSKRKYSWVIEEELCC
jgi:hypothetical protein